MVWWTRRRSIASLPTRSCGRPVWDGSRARRPALSPICAPFLRFRTCGRGPLPRQAASAGEQVAEAQVVCQVLKRLQMPIVGPHSSLPPTPYGDGIDAETTGDLHPRQAGRVLEPHQPLREVVWEGVGLSPVLCALSRHSANPCHGRPQSPPRRGCPGRQPCGARSKPFSRRPEAPTHPDRERPLALPRPSPYEGFSCCQEDRAIDFQLYPLGPETVNSSRLESFLPSAVQTAPSASQSVVTGRTMVTSAAESGVTVMVHPMLLPWVSRRALVTSRNKESMFGDNAPVWGFISRIGPPQYAGRTTDLAQNRAFVDFKATRNAADQTHLIEVYPALALPALGPEFMDRNSAARYNPQRETFNLSDWELVCNSVAHWGDELGLQALSQWAREMVEPWDSSERPEKRHQDKIDAALCLIIALLWRRQIPGVCVVGDLDTGYIVTPTSPETQEILEAACNKRGVDFG